MGRFAWTPSHRSQPSDGKHKLPEWFSKSSGEPSRQALTELVKEHHSNSPPKRSRTNTLSSVPSRGSKSTSSRSSSGRPSRPASRQQRSEGSESSPGRHETPTQTLLSKSSKIMRRQTSRFNALSSQLNEAVSNSDSQGRAHGIHRVKSAGHLLSLHSKRELNKPQISGPFDFQHVAHTDQSQYQNLCKSNKIDLIDSFDALQAVQQPHQDVQEMPLDDLHLSATVEVPASESRPQSPTFSIVPSLPSESPKPSPPPKDHLRLPSADLDVRTSKSVDNFSWPNRSSPLLDNDHEAQQQGDFDEEPVAPTLPLQSTRFLPDNGHYVSLPSSPHHSHLAPSPMLDKPLPQPPTIVHAVSTTDLSTLFLKSTPLPEVPQQQAQSSGHSSNPDSKAEALSPKAPKYTPRHSVRHMQSFPVDSGSRRRSQSSTEMPLAAPLAMAAEALASPPRPAQVGDRVSVGIKAIDIDDWEDAIDYSWDHALDIDEEDVVEMYDSRAMSKSDVLPQTSFGTHRISNNTPQQSSFPVRGIRHHKSELSLHGLGINRAHRYSSMYSPDFGTTSSKRESLRVPYSYRTSGSPMSKSSSQESIILSIASSIMSTHRSSNSSTSLGDINQLCSIEDECSVPFDYSHSKASNGGSISSSETVTTDNKSIPASHNTSEDTIVELPTLGHHRGASTPHFPFVPNRRSSMTPAGKAAVRQRASTLTGRGTNSRASYSLFPAAQPAPPAV